MNMQKALQHLYKAVSGQDTSKVNISKLLVDIHQAVTGKESANKNNWSRIIDSMAENWSGGGGNPNYVQTITGTTADPWGGIAKALHTAIANGGASATIAFNMGQQTLQVPLSNNIGTAGFIIRYGNYYPNDGNIFEFYATWFFDDDTSDVIRLYNADVIEGSNGSYTHTDYKNMASMIQTTLTIIWHPLPIGD